MDFSHLVVVSDIVTAARMRFQAGRKEEIDLDLDGWQALDREIEDGAFREYIRQRIQEFTPAEPEPSQKAAEPSQSDAGETLPQPPKTLDVLIRDYFASASETDEQREALRRIEALQLTQGQILLLHRQGYAELDHIALQQFGTQPWPQKDCIFMYERAKEGSELEQLAEQKILWFVRTFDGWEEIQHDASPGSKLDTLALNQMQKLSVTFDQKHRFFQATSMGSEWEERALRDMNEFAKTDEDWVTILEEVPTEYNLYITARQRIRSFTLPFEGWVRVGNLVDVSDDRELSEFVLTKLIETEPDNPPLV